LRLFRRAKIQLPYIIGTLNGAFIYLIYIKGVIDLKIEEI